MATPSPLVADILRQSGIPDEKLACIDNGVAVHQFEGATPTLRNELGCADRPLVGFVARLEPGKGGAVLLQAAQSVLAACPKTTFVLVGEGPSRKDWEAIAADLRIADRVVFTGTRADMPGVYASFDIFVLPSKMSDRKSTRLNSSH